MFQGWLAWRCGLYAQLAATRIERTTMFEQRVEERMAVVRARSFVKALLESEVSLSSPEEHPCYLLQKVEGRSVEEVPHHQPGDRLPVWVGA